ncbi:MAG: hypothetical protein HYV15_07345 [Elusimicrobia bacterium]|nr:hypothetical protein [Elusimicrobiota bacterium]
MLALWGLLAALHCAPSWAAPGVVSDAISVSGGTRAYFLQTATGAAPTVGLVVFHGAVTPENLLRGVTSYYQPLLAGLAAEHRLLVVYPEGRRGRCPWDEGLVCWPMRAPREDGPFIRALVGRLSRETGVRRWLALGISNGGYFLASAIEGGETLPFEAVVTVVGGKGWYGPLAVRWRPALTILAGSRDEQDKENGGAARRLYEELRADGYEASAPLRYEEFDGGHEVPEVRLKEVLAGLLARPRGR